MARQVKFFLILLFTLPFYSTFLHAETADSGRHISRPAWQQLTNDKAFSYKNEIEQVTPVAESKPSVFERFAEVLFNFLVHGLGKVLIWLIVFLAIVFVLYKVIRNNENFIFGRNREKIKNVIANGGDEDLDAGNWEVLTNKAIQQNDLRLAVRYSYMWLLQLLQEQQLIQYKAGKTNFEYYRELEPTKFKQPFKQLSRKYEYSHYGNYPVTASDYREYSELFNNIRKQLGR